MCRHAICTAARRLKHQQQQLHQRPSGCSKLLFRYATTSGVKRGEERQRRERGGERERERTGACELRNGKTENSGTTGINFFPADTDHGNVITWHPEEILSGSEERKKKQVPGY